jgi:hypothetical protein
MNTRCKTVYCHNWDNHRIHFLHCLVNLRTYPQYVEFTSSSHEGKHPLILFFVWFCLKWTYCVPVWSLLIFSGRRDRYTTDVIYCCLAWIVFWNELYPGSITRYYNLVSSLWVGILQGCESIWQNIVPLWLRRCVL